MMVRRGDLMFTRSSTVISGAIKFFTHGKFSHVQTVIDTEPKLTVISADAEGVMYRDVREEDFDDYEILSYPEMTEKERDDVAKFCFRQVGQSYDYTGLSSFLINTDLNKEEAFFCS